MSPYGYRVQLLPLLTPGEAKPLVPFRIRNDKGESALCNVDGAGCIASLEFPKDGQPRANHFHRIKTEYIFLSKGRLRGFFRPAQNPDLPIEIVDIEEGSVVTIAPGCSHAFVALEAGYGLEWSRESWAVVREDAYDDVLVAT